MALPVVMTTDAVAKRDRAPQWREWVSQHFNGLESELYGDAEFDGHMSASHAGDVILTRLQANRHRVTRNANMARTSQTDYLKIVAPWLGSATVTQHGRQASARAGNWMIYDTTAGYEIANPQPVEHLILMLPKRHLTERGVRLDSLMGRNVGGAQGVARLALESMRTTYQELPNMSAAAAAGAGDLIKQLVQLSLLELSGQETASTQRLMLRDRIVGHISRHLGDPDLTAESIAIALRCSRRHLYNAFEGENESLAVYIQRLRMQACVTEFKNTQVRERPITEVAMSWGFGSLSHFSRAFREHTGLSPSEFRQSARVVRTDL
jgi:AraC-like DNA-binding protein